MEAMAMGLPGVCVCRFRLNCHVYQCIGVCVCVSWRNIQGCISSHSLSLSHRPQRSSTFPSLSHCAVIATNWSGVTEFTTEDNSYLVPVKVRPYLFFQIIWILFGDFILFYFIHVFRSLNWQRGERVKGTCGRCRRSLTFG